MKTKYLMLGLMFTMSTSILFAQNKLNRQDSLEKEAAKSEIWQPVPKLVTTSEYGTPPSDAIILFDGKSLNNFQKKNGDAAAWKINEDGSMTVVKGSGDIQTKQSFGSAQLHIEWKTPTTISGSNQTRANSGVYLMSTYELQVLDSYNNPTYCNGQAGSLYKQHIPLVNVSKKPGEWQTYDIIFTRPIFTAEGKLASPGRVTLLYNNVLVLNNVTILGATQWIGLPQYTAHADKLPLLLQDHGFDGGQPLSFRNIWIRNLE